jgi:hypothetical protein
MLRGKRIYFVCCFAFLGVSLLRPSPARAQGEWLPIDPADLAMKDEPLAPGAPAIYLYREALDDDDQAHEDFYFRIKVLTEEGKKYGNVELLYSKGLTHISDIRGRTIHADGTVVPWNGKAVDQTVVKARGVKVQEKTFTLPDVEVGGIIEYRYRTSWDPQLLMDTTWYYNENLFTRQAHFILKPSLDSGYDLLSRTQNMPPNSAPQKEKDGKTHLDLQNVPGIEDEQYAPPESVLKGRVDFFYVSNMTLDPVKYWKQVGKDRDAGIEQFVGRHKEIEGEVARIVQANDSPEIKLRKLYDRAQQIRYLSFEPDKSDEELKREKLKDINNVVDILKYGYAWGNDINWFFLALVRAAGFQASPVIVSERSTYFFVPSLLDSRELNEAVVAVNLNGQDIYLDPATKHCPFGLLPWDETGVQGIKLDKDGGSFVTTPPPKSSDALIERTGTLQMSNDGWLTGTLAVNFNGQEALWRRNNAENQDDETRTKNLTDTVKSWLPAGATLDLTNQPDWAGSETPLHAEFKVRTKFVGASTGRRLLMSESLLSNLVAVRFDHPVRTYPIYFDYPMEFTDDINLTLAIVLQPESIPPAVHLAAPGYGQYDLTCEQAPGALHFHRQMSLTGFYYDVPYYTDLRAYFDHARSTDGQQVIIDVRGTHEGP